MLAGLLKAPSRYAPSSAPARAQARAKQVLVNMQNADMLDKKELRQASAKLNKIINIKQTGSRHGVMYFTDWLVEELPNYVGKIEEDINVITTLNPRYQAIAEKQVEKYLAAHGKELNISQGALLSMSPGGAIRAMVGGRSYLKSQFNRTLQAKRQPGSAFKLFVYLAGLQAGLEPDSVMEDKSITVQTRQGEWQPTNYNDEFQGFMTLSEAMAKSINTVAVQVAEQVGLQTITAMAKRLGVATPVLAIPSIALGTEEITMLELTTGYAHLANNGYGVIPHGIQEIRTPSGKLLYRFQPSSWQAIDSAHVGHMNRMLQDAVTHGTGRAARLDRPVAGKTGTSQDFRDAWFVGYTPELVTSVWVGNDNAKPMKDVTGGTAPAIIWKNYMKNALAGTSAKKLPTSKSGDLPWGGDSFWERLFGN
jgi:penicillin-binding protein 1A